MNNGPPPLPPRTHTLQSNAANVTTSLQLVADSVLSDAAVAKLKLAENQVDAYRLYEYKHQYSVKNWFKSKLKEQTFASSWIELNFPEIQALAWKSKQLKAHTPQKNSGPVAARSNDDKSESEAHNAVLSALIRRIETHLNADPALKEKGFFIKVGNRSAKDAPINSFRQLKMKALLREHLLWLDERKQRNSSTEAVAYSKSIIQMLQLNKAEEVVEAIIHSQLIINDLNQVISFGESLYLPEFLIFREFNGEVASRLQYELRAFVYNKDLTALSQHLNCALCPELINNQPAIQAKISEFYYQLQPFIPYKHYIINFIILREKLLIVDISPFTVENTAALFDWRSDREILTGRKPFQFRILDRISPNLTDSAIDSQWKQWIALRCRPMSNYQRFLAEHESILTPILLVLIVAAFVQAGRIILGYSKWTNPQMKH
jgi:hypothetical protein